MATNQQQTVTVTLKQGALRGRIVPLSEKLGGGHFYSFQGIPYAEPPIGQLRFKAPVPASSWEGVRDAFTEGPRSLQKDVLGGTNQIIGNEDCLYLNVYIPGKQPFDSLQCVPVMVWIYGGSYEEGSGENDLYGPEFFMKNGSVLLVTINYRVGPLGFMSLGTKRIPGNAGLKDQVLALKWVQENIRKFRGDPHNVTIFGQSAGAACVHFLMLTPTAKGLFHRVILQSGCALNTWAYMDKNENKTHALRLAKALGCDSQDVDVVADFLQQVSAYTLTERKAEAAEDINDLVSFTFQPCNEECFLSDSPKELLKVGNFEKVPILMGANSLEGFTLNIFLGIPNFFQRINQDLSIIIPKNLLQGKSAEKQKNIVERVKKFYFGDNPISDQNVLQMFKMGSDIYFLIGIFDMVKNFLKFAPNQPLYLYLFSFEGSLGLFKRIISGGKPSVPGVCHADELGYLFNAQKYTPEPEPGTQEFVVMERMVEIWTNFAKKVNPAEDVQWKAYTKENPSFLNISASLNLQQDYFKERIEFWEKILNEH